mgnify:CR=1 FL=1
METVKWIQEISTFIKVAEEGSFSKSAQTLGVSKSHISKTIKQLEQDLGVNLFLRSTRKVQLTSIGQQLYDSCSDSVRSLEQVKENILSGSDQPRGVLRVTNAGLFGEKVIGPVLISMAKKYPKLKVELDFDNRIIDLIEEKFDIGIRFGALPDSALMAEKIATRREYVCCSPAYLEAHPKISKPEDLLKHNCFGGSKKWTFKKNGKKLQISIEGNFKTNNPRVIHRAGLDGLGIIRLPDSYVVDDIREGRLISLLEDYKDDRMNIWAVSPFKKEKNINVKIFMSELKKILKNNI